MGCTSLPAFSFACLILIALTSARDFGYSREDLLSEDRTVSLYESWLAKHNKVYTLAEEKQQRYEIFRDNLIYIDEVNQQNLSYWLGLTKFADMSHDEFKSKYLIDIPRGHDQKFRYENDSDVPESVDWRTKGAVTAVKDQGECGTNWAFSVTGAVEGTHQIQNGNLVSLSEQQLIDCNKPQNNGCKGGDVDAGFEFIVSNGGLDSESDYPYQGKDGQCVKKKLSDKVASITGYEIWRGLDNLLRELAGQPVSVGIDASGKNFRLYKGGVLSGPCGNSTNSFLVAVGYGSEQGSDYIIGKNSWGTQWGEEGYIKLHRSTSAEGQCGIYQHIDVPTTYVD